MDDILCERVRIRYERPARRKIDSRRWGRRLGRGRRPLRRPV